MHRYFGKHILVNRLIDYNHTFARNNLVKTYLNVFGTQNLKQIIILQVGILKHGSRKLKSEHHSASAFLEFGS